MKKINLIHLYRGLAAIYVLLFHINLVMLDKLHYQVPFRFFRLGYVGVDFFFVLSGFIIAYTHYRDFGKRQAVKDYFLKRFIRIYPIYWVFVLIVPLVYTLLRKNAVFMFHIDPLFILKTVTLYQHWPMFVPAAWSLSYEIYFYLIFGAMLYILTWSQSLVVFAVYAVAVAAINYFLSSAPYQAIPIDYYVLEFILGIAAAWIITVKPAVSKRLSVTLFVASVTILVVVAYKYLQIDLSPIGIQKYRPLTFGISFMLLLIASVWLEKNYSFRSNAFFNSLGDVSYNLYLMHPQVITLLAILIRDRIHIPSQYLSYAILPMFFISLAVSYILYYFLERNLITFLRKKLLTGSSKRVMPVDSQAVAIHHVEKPLQAPTTSV